MNEFDSPIRRLKQAIRKSHQFYIMQKRYLESDYRSTVVEVDQKTGCELHKIKIIAFPDDLMTDLAYEAIETYRSVLDHVAYATAVLSGLEGPDLERIYFPMSKTVGGVENAIASGCRGIHPKIVELFRGYQADPGGDADLANLNLIRKQGYHRIIIPVGSIAQVEPGLASATNALPAYIPGPIWDSKNHELVFRARDANGEFGYNAKITFTIAFGEVDGVGGKPVWPFLLKTAKTVDRIIKETESESQRIWR